LRAVTAKPKCPLAWAMTLNPNSLRLRFRSFPDKENGNREAGENEDGDAVIFLSIIYPAIGEKNFVSASVIQTAAQHKDCFTSFCLLDLALSELFRKNAQYELPRKLTRNPWMKIIP
jgi:hypothetical protein